LTDRRRRTPAILGQEIHAPLQLAALAFDMGALAFNMDSCKLEHIERPVRGNIDGPD